MTVWVLVIAISGTGTAAVVLPFEYPTQEACIAAADQPNVWKYVCVPSPSTNGGE